MKDEKKHHGTVKLSPSEQQFRKSNVIIPLLSEKSGGILVGLAAGSPAGSQIK